MAEVPWAILSFIIYFGMYVILLGGAACLAKRKKKQTPNLNHTNDSNTHQNIDLHIAKNHKANLDSPKNDTENSQNIDQGIQIQISPKKHSNDKNYIANIIIETKENNNDNNNNNNNNNNKDKKNENKKNKKKEIENINIEKNNNKTKDENVQNAAKKIKVNVKVVNLK